MSLSLYLVRHAQSADKQSGQSDHDRALTPYGMMQAEQLGKIFFRRQYFFDKIICSTARRTVQTWQQMAKHFQHIDLKNVFHESLLYEGTAIDYEDLVKSQESTLKHLLIVGHNPSISQVAHLFCRNIDENFHPGGFSLINFGAHTWNDVSSHESTIVELLNTPVQ